MLRRLSYELLRGFAYRRIKHRDMATYTTWLPLLLTAVVVALYHLLPVKPVLLGKDGAAAGALAVLSTLPGFYFAGLAAVATFGSNDMDKEMPNPAPEVDILVSGQRITAKLTRRLFLTYLFSYLVLVSFILCFALLIINILTGSIALLEAWLLGIQYGSWILNAFKLIVGSVLTLLSMSLAVTTLHGVFFLTEKMHQP